MKKMNIDDLTLGQIKELSKLQLGGELEEKKPDMMSHLIGEKVIIRDHKGGVYVTTLEDVDGKQWRGGLSRKIFYWDKAGAVQGISTTGIDLSNSKITVKTPISNGYELVEICPCDDDVYDSIMGASVWNPK